MTWTRIDASLPEADSTVLVAIKDQDFPVWIGYHDAEGWHGVDGCDLEPTHWAPMPEAP